MLNTLNTRLDAAAIAFMLDHGDAKVLITDREFASTIKTALKLAKVKPLVIDYDDREFPQTGECLGTMDYEEFVVERRRRISLGVIPTTNGTRLRSTTPPARRAIPKASCFIIAAPH